MVGPQKLALYGIGAIKGLLFVFWLLLTCFSYTL